jgi:putative hydrolase of the HAD superfamily
MTALRITALFLDIGNVLLTNGWDHAARRRAAETFGLDAAQMEERHQFMVDIYEEGRATLDEYLACVVFHRDRAFTPEAFKTFIFAQSQPRADMIGLMRRLKQRHGLRMTVVNNEGREINAYRIQTFGFVEFVDTFVSSCFVHMRKPDPGIYQLALDVTQVSPGEVGYIDDRALLIDAGRRMGLRAIHHTGYESTRSALAEWGLADEA